MFKWLWKRRRKFKPSDGIYTVPTGLTHLHIQMVGGGGSGGAQTFGKDLTVAQGPDIEPTKTSWSDEPELAEKMAKVMAKVIYIGSDGKEVDATEARVRAFLDGYSCGYCKGQQKGFGDCQDVVNKFLREV